MSYRLISSNDIAIKYPEVNDMPCIYADLPNGMDGEHYVLEQEPKTGYWITQWNVAHQKEYYYCSECREEFSYDGETGIKMNDYNFCPNCGAKMVEPQESEE